MNRGRRWVLAALALAAVTIAPSLRYAAADTGSLAGTAGTDTSLPATDSAVTVAGRGDRFADLKVTVSQTKDLVNQAVSVTWTGGRASSGFAGNWLQIFQCWGEDDGTHPENPGPPPEQCEFGGEPFAGNVSPKIPSDAHPSNVYSRAISDQSWSTFDPNQGIYDPDTGKVWKPFKAVDGTVVPTQLKLRNTVENGNNSVTVAWQNPYFDFTTTNEDDWGKTYGTGTGSELFQVDTGLEATGLGCGQRILEQPDGTKTIPKCWLVVVPRGTPAEENPANLTADGFQYVAVSPLAPTAWENRIAIPLEFNPVDGGCAIGGNQRRIVGGEPATAAVTNWQPALCATPGSPPYAYQAIGDNQARLQLLSGAPGAAGMSIVSRPLEPANVDPADPVTYAPIALSGVVIGFNVERVETDYSGNVVDPAEVPIRGIRVTHLNLTPRLVAKLLTQSYRQQFPNLDGAQPPTGYEWVANNRAHLFEDPDFLRFNPEFNVMSIGTQKTGAGLVVEAATSDAAAQLWRWVMADPEASAWLASTADPWGMKVNPVYSTDPAINPSGTAFGDPVPDAFPKNDPFCHQEPPQGDVTPRPLCVLDANPYALSLEQAAKATRAANDGAQTTHDSGSATQQTGTTWWGADGPERQGARSILSVTDAASAARYGLQTASLSRSGDDNDGRTFVAPDGAGLLAGQRAMVPSAIPEVLTGDPATTAAGAYPLPLLTYAAVAARDLDTAARDDYASFLTYAAGPGQTQGVKFGQLPPGYAPLPDALRAETLAAAAAVRAGDPGPTDVALPNDNVELPAPPSAVPSDLAVLGDTSAFAELLESPLTAPLLSDVASGSPSALDRPAVPGGTTPKLIAGAIRYTMPSLLAVGLLAALGVLLLDDRRLRARALTTP